MGGSPVVRAFVLALLISTGTFTTAYAGPADVIGAEAVATSDGLPHGHRET